MKDSKLKRMLVSAYEVFYEARRMFVLRTHYRLPIMSWQRTIRYIEKHKCSIARFGDGELDLILHSRDLGFQSQSEEISLKLKEVLRNTNPKLLACVSSGLNTTSGCTKHAKEFWIYWGKKNDHQKEIVHMIWSCRGKYKKLGDTLLTRPYIDWKTDKRARKTFPALQRLWAGRDILIVEGRYTCMGVGNDIFAPARSVRRIIAPATGAFEHYQQILDAILAHRGDRLVIMALGPTATILAADLADRDIQALDIGHIDIEYEWFLMGAKERVQIPGKFTNEAKDRQAQPLCTDPVYLSQILQIIE